MDKNFEKFIKTQIKYFNDAKFYEGINSKKDPGDFFLINFIQTSASTIREKWENSKCKCCKNWQHCADLLKCECIKYEIDPMENDI